MFITRDKKITAVQNSMLVKTWITLKKIGEYKYIRRIEL